jgi:hypothetical protein
VVDRHSGTIEAHGGFIRELIAAQGDLTLVEAQARLIERPPSGSTRCIASSCAMESRAKETGHAIEQVNSP